ncbi:MAG: retropepsin-like domain-containing protein [Alphaproteobacteria bacterium]|nr:retropepsin-like domain-containing protein [Alphaproteobacteria bacterium]MDA8012513.1 retropepsin-like domain-containing protein [Alphaproteobacteria bacterium]
MFFVTVKGKVRRQHPDDGGRLLTRAKVRDAGLKALAKQPEGTEKFYTALVDTGATISGIQGELARRLDFTVGVKRFIDTPHGGNVTDIYELDMTLPGGLMFHGVHAAELVGLRGIDIVIGMDIIRKSVLIVNGSGQSFRMFFPRRFVAPRSLSSF